MVTPSFSKEVDRDLEKPPEADPFGISWAGNLVTSRRFSCYRCMRAKLLKSDGCHRFSEA
jgi:hypothetical protein